MSSRGMVVTRADLERVVAEHGLRLTRFDAMDHPVIRIEVAPLESSVVKWSAPIEREKKLREHLNDPEVCMVGYQWRVGMNGPGPYRSPGNGG